VFLTSRIDYPKIIGQENTTIKNIGQKARQLTVTS